MAEIKVYNLDGKEVETLNVEDGVFNIAVKESVIKDVATAYLSNQRGSYAHTKTKGEVRGGGKKPWKQKGTGRARHGSIRSPLWVGGGITFGPRSERNYNVKINKKLKDRAMAMLLSDKLVSGNLIVVDNIELKDLKTKVLVSLVKGLFKKLNKSEKGNSIIIVEKNKNMDLASRNIQRLEAVSPKNLNILSVLKSENLIFDKNSLLILEKRILKDKNN